MLLSVRIAKDLAEFVGKNPKAVADLTGEVATALDRVIQVVLSGRREPLKNFAFEASGRVSHLISLSCETFGVVGEIGTQLQKNPESLSRSPPHLAGAFNLAFSSRTKTCFRYRFSFCSCSMVA